MERGRERQKRMEAKREENVHELVCVWGLIMYNLYARIIQYFLVHFLSEYKCIKWNVCDSVKQNHPDDKAPYAAALLHG